MRPWGWAPGHYVIRCECTPADARFTDMPDGAKGSWRCEACARKLKAEVQAVPAVTPPASESREDTLERLLRQRFSRSSPIEEKLQMAGMGKRPLPTAAECLEWAAKLGVPDEANAFLT